MKIKLRAFGVTPQTASVAAQLIQIRHAPPSRNHKVLATHTQMMPWSYINFTQIPHRTLPHKIT